MDILIQNTSAAPIYIAVVKNREGKPTALPRIILEPDNQITKVSQEIYELMLTLPFYKEKIEQGVLVPLNGSSAKVDDAVKESIQVKELNFARYVALVNKIQASGGLANDQLRPHLDAEGMPSTALLQKNLGTGVDPQSFEEFRTRYLVEKKNGMHESQIVLPTGFVTNAGSEQVEIKEDKGVEPGKEEPGKEDELETLSLEQLKEKADEFGVEYDEAITFKRLLKRIKAAQKV